MLKYDASIQLVYLPYLDIVELFVISKKLLVLFRDNPKNDNSINVDFALHMHGAEVTTVIFFCTIMPSCAIFRKRAT
jgi:hypothetical protein